MAFMIARCKSVPFWSKSRSRTRSGEFRPASLPPPYQRGYPAETQALLLGLLASARSINAAKQALEKLGLSRS